MGRRGERKREIEQLLLQEHFQVSDITPHSTSNMSIQLVILPYTTPQSFFFGKVLLLPPPPHRSRPWY